MKEYKICTIKEIQKMLPSISKSSASQKMCLLRDALNKPKPQFITVDEFKDYYGLDE